MSELIEKYISEKRKNPYREVGICNYCKKMIFGKERFITNGLFAEYADTASLVSLKEKPIHVRCERPHNRELIKMLARDLEITEGRYWALVTERAKGGDDGVGDRDSRSVD